MNTHKWLRMLRTPVGAVSGALLFMILVLALFAPLVWGDRAAAVDTGAMLQSPSPRHLLGTDQLGQDIFFRVLVAARLSILLAVLATLIGVVAGIVLGTAPAVLPRWAGRLVTSVVNVMVAFPGLLLVLFFAVIFGATTKGALVAVGLAFAPKFARLVQTLTASVSGRDYIDAARVAGVGRLRILGRHILPNIAEPLVVNATVGAGDALLTFAGLSFLGIGVQAPSYDWGVMLQEGLTRIYTNPAAALGPGVAVVIAGLAFNLTGESAAGIIGGRGANNRLRSAPRAGLGMAATETPPESEVALAVADLQVSLPGPDGWITPVRGVSFSVRTGEAVGVVGESGSGKSLTALAVGRLLEAPAQVTASRLEFAGHPLLGRSSRDLRSLLGTSLAMVFQDPMTSFNPTRRIGRQLADVSEWHQGLGRRAALARAVDRLRAVRVTAAERRAHQYPHEFSGGMRQRAMIAMGLMGEPSLIIADEPTTALDVTVQRDVLRLLTQIRTATSAALLLISHDIDVVLQTCDRVLVMYAGRIIEDLPTDQLESRASHPYTRALLAAVPDMETDRTQPLAVIPGRPPTPDLFPTGCAFAARCPYATQQCADEDPMLAHTGPGQQVACWHPVNRSGSSRSIATSGGNHE